MKTKRVSIQKLNATYFRAVCIACFLLAVLFIILVKRDVTGKAEFSEFFQKHITTASCKPIGQYDQYNPCLIKYVQENLLLPPSGLPYTPSSVTKIKGIPVTAAVEEKIDFIRKHFIIGKSSSPGFFIECGANDGMFLSPTLKLEREYNWTGVLIEGDPAPFKQLVALHRNAWMLNAALCTKTNSEMVTFYSREDFTASGGFKPVGKSKAINVPCIPLYTVLTALEITTVDFFSLDVEGVELDVLKTVPFDEIIFKVLIVEHAHVPGFQPAVIDFLQPNKYVFIGTFYGNGMQDSLFVHESVYTSDMSLKLKFDTNKGKK